MAMVGASIGLSFAVSLVAAPLLYSAIGMSGMFVLIGLMSLAAIAVVRYVVPDVAALPPASVRFSEVLKMPELLRLNYGVFTLHLSQMSMFVVVPAALVKTLDLPVAQHWKVYLPVVLLSFVLMLPPVFVGERQGKMKGVFIGAIALLLAVQIGMWFELSHGVHWAPLVGLLLAFFVAFNILEASQPSLVSRFAPAGGRGAALGVYNTLQALGLFCGGAAGGWLTQHLGPSTVFIMGGSLTVLWLIIAAGMKNLPRRGKEQQPAAA
jgi:predicted MFS family arabinose efflux permease